MWYENTEFPVKDLDITHPSVYARLPENPPEDLVKLCAKYMMSGCNRAQILYDPAVIGALVKRGTPYRMPHPFWELLQTEEIWEKEWLRA